MALGSCPSGGPSRNVFSRTYHFLNCVGGGPLQGKAHQPRWGSLAQRGEAFPEERFLWNTRVSIILNIVATRFPNICPSICCVSHSRPLKPTWPMDARTATSFNLIAHVGTTKTNEKTLKLWAAEPKQQWAKKSLSRAEVDNSLIHCGTLFDIWRRVGLWSVLQIKIWTTAVYLHSEVQVTDQQIRVHTVIVYIHLLFTQYQPLTWNQMYIVSKSSVVMSPNSRLVVWYTSPVLKDT